MSMICQVFSIHRRVNRYFLAVISVCFLYLALSSLIYFGLIDRHKDLVPNHQALLTDVVANITESRVLSQEDRAFFNVVIANTRARPAHLARYFLYDASARIANREMTKYLKTSDGPLPVFASRLDEHNQLLESAKSKWSCPAAPSSPTARAERPTFCVGVLSARRRDSPTSTLSQTVISMLTRMNALSDREEFYIHVFNTDEDPSKHSDVDEISHLVPVTRLKNKRYKTFTKKQQQTMDYVEALEIMHRLECPYATLLEDDTLADNHWTDKIREAASLVKDRPWTLLRLFTSKGEVPEGKLDSRVPEHGLVAMMYNRDYLPMFAKYLEDDFLKNVHEYVAPNDLVLPRLWKTISVPSFAFYPVIFQHIGVFSSVQVRSMKQTLTMNTATSKYFDSEHIPVVFDKDRWLCPQPN